MTQTKSSTPVWLAYLGLWITGIIFLATEKNDQEMRWHAANSLAVFGIITVAQIALSILSFIFGLIPVLGVIIGILFTILIVAIWVATVVAWILLMVKASKGERQRIPWATNFAENVVSGWFK